MTKNYTPYRLISYVVASDTGLAPNVTGNICTLAVCKPVIRKVASVGEDWIIGVSTNAHGANRLIYAMQVDEKLSYKDYFKDERFAGKKSPNDRRGDNFFQFKNGEYGMAFKSSAHFGKEKAIELDLREPTVVIGKKFWYFGDNAPELPDDLSKTNLVVPGGGRRGHRINDDPDVIESFVEWISQYKTGIHGKPRDSALSKAVSLNSGRSRT